MKVPQFSVGTLLTITAFVAIALGGVSAWAIWILEQDRSITGITAVLVAVVHTPIWLPLAFVGYAIGRRTFTIRMLIVFAVAELVGGAASFWAIKQF